MVVPKEELHQDIALCLGDAKNALTMMRLSLVNALLLSEGLYKMASSDPTQPILAISSTILYYSRIVATGFLGSSKYEENKALRSKDLIGYLKTLGRPFGDMGTVIAAIAVENQTGIIGVVDSLHVPYWFYFANKDLKRAKTIADELIGDNIAPFGPSVGMAELLKFNRMSFDDMGNLVLSVDPAHNRGKQMTGLRRVAAWLSYHQPFQRPRAALSPVIKTEKEKAGDMARGMAHSMR